MYSETVTASFNTVLVDIGGFATFPIYLATMGDSGHSLVLIGNKT